MKYRNNSSIKIYFVWQLIGTIIDVGISLLLFLGGKALFNWLNSIFSDVGVLTQFLIVAFGYIGGVIAAIACAAAAIGTLVELFNGDIEFYVEKTLKPSKTFVITEKMGICHYISRNGGEFTINGTRRPRQKIRLNLVMIINSF